MKYMLQYLKSIPKRFVTLFFVILMFTLVFPFVTVLTVFQILFGDNNI